MDEQEFKDRCRRLKEVNKVIAALDTAIREPAYAALEPYVTGQPSGKRTPPKHDSDRNGDEQEDTSNLDRDEFILAHHKRDDEPADNALLLTAWHYKEYGSEPFSYAEIKTLANDAGLTTPDRIDMTFKTAKAEGKSSFTPAGRGKVRPTVHGEKRLKDTYNIKKGTKKKTENDS